MILADTEIVEYLRDHDFLWQYDNDPTHPHAKLTSGKHSNGFVNVGQALREDPDFRENVADTLLRFYSSAAGPNQWFDYVVGADTSSTRLAQDVARLCGAGHLKMIKTEDSTEKKQLWSPANPSLRDGDTVIQVEELVTTSFSASLVRQGMRVANPGVDFHFSPHVLTVVDRSDPLNRVTQIEGSRLLSLIRLEIRNYDAENCPYCFVGSVALEPKVDNNWAILTGKA